MKKFTAIIAGFIMTVALSINTFAGQWSYESKGWRYQNDDGTYPYEGWEWIDGDRDGVAECYYFYDEGWLACSKDIDGHYVDEAGRWTVDGQVQTKVSPGYGAGIVLTGQGYTDIYKQYTAQYGETKFVKQAVEYDADSTIEQLEGINFLGLYDLDGNGVEELLIGFTVPDPAIYEGRRFVLDVFTDSGSGVIFCGRIDGADMWSGGEQSCGVRLMSNAGKVYVVGGSAGTGAGSIYTFYTLDDGALTLKHTYEFDERGIFIDGQESNIAYDKVWDGWTRIGHYDSYGYVYSGYEDPEYTMDQTRELIEKTKAKLGV